MMPTTEFQWVAINTERFAIFENHFIPNKKVELSSSCEFMMDTESKRVAVFVSFNFTCAQNTIIELEVNCHFEIDKNSCTNFSQDDAIRIPLGFARHLCMLTIGTARGILHSKIENTSFKSFILPTINLAELVKEEIFFKI